MQSSDLVAFGVFFLVLAAVARPLGHYVAACMDGSTPTFAWLRWIEGQVVRLAGVDPDRSMSWKEFAIALLMFNAVGAVVMFSMLVGIDGLSWHLAMNTTISFVTNTNWQSYSGETTLSATTQMLCCSVQNFASPATGFAVLAMISRAIGGRAELGSFWIDVLRFLLYVLLPLSLILAVILVTQGVLQTAGATVTIDHVGAATQTVHVGPVASQVAIKQLGTNGGGYYGVNSAHPLENPTSLTNLFECIALLLIPVAMPFTYARMIKRDAQAWPIVGAMLVLFVVGLSVASWAETQGTAALGGQISMEGKEARFSPIASALWSTATTATSNGSVNGMHDSFMPLTGFVQMMNMLVGEVIFGGIGSGMYGMILFIIVAVFISGLMVGRTPEYMGRKIEATEIKLAMSAILIPNVTILLVASLAALLPAGTSSIANPGPHGLSEILYAAASTVGNNGSAFAGLATNTVFYNSLLSVAILIGRYAVILPILAIAGSLSKKTVVPASAGTLPTDTFLFGLLLLMVIVIVGALTFFPVLALGPLVEHSLFNAGISF
ncbi:MAG: potassium-transporting ATPase subunit KdpA [Bacteroidetes bacterium]|nr:potassium-transporting ATPase subunit KdpA [Bacteroidota bacterium]